MPDPHKVWVYWYWPRSDRRRIHIGWGAHRAYVPAALVTMLAGLALIVGLALAGYPGIAQWLGGVLVIVELALTTSGRPYWGWYEVDARGQPLRYLRSTMPAGIYRRRGMTRGRFIAQARL